MAEPKLIRGRIFVQNPPADMSEDDVNEAADITLRFWAITDELRADGIDSSIILSSLLTTLVNFGLMSGATPDSITTVLTDVIKSLPDIAAKLRTANMTAGRG